ncbi:Crp/Fnr family transcriptional regulator [Listeria costaricensis]|uniref:Crp/Fnr family transcriptional regulator n=1 Tax=Listeria costaricensis TaxID=2026604 RepID=UPI000C086FBE|nr:Crp/Fnr family transcriptional regulator [Listeria costaricensis]
METMGIMTENEVFTYFQKQDNFSKFCHVVELQKEDKFPELSSTEYIYFIEHGLVCYQYEGGSKTIIPAFLWDGDMISPFRQKALSGFSLYFYALKDTKMWRIQKKEAERYLRRSNWLNRLYHNEYSQEREVIQNLYHRGFYSAEKLVIACLYQLASRYCDEDASEWVLPNEITQALFANYVGISREHLSGIITELLEGGQIHTEQKAWKVLDANKTRNIYASLAEINL